MHADAPSPTWGKAGMGANKKVCLVMKQVDKKIKITGFFRPVYTLPLSKGESSRGCGKEGCIVLKKVDSFYS